MEIYSVRDFSNEYETFRDLRIIKYRSLFKIRDDGIGAEDLGVFLDELGSSIVVE